MIISLPKDELKRYIRLQCDNFFPDGHRLVGDDVDKAFCDALDRIEHCFQHVVVRGYRKDGESYFNHLHSDQYAVFLYFFANSLWNISQNSLLGDKLFYLNKALHGVFLSYRYKLPDIFLLSHPLGTVIGNPVCGDYLVVAQNVTIEGNGAWGVILPGSVTVVFLHRGRKFWGNAK